MRNGHAWKALYPKLNLIFIALACCLQVTSATAVAHPLDELSDTPYQAHAPDSLDVAVSLEKDLSVELGFFINIRSLLESDFAPTEFKSHVTERPDQPLSPAAIEFSKSHVRNLIEMYADETLQEGTLNFRELQDTGVLPDDGIVWSQITYEPMNSNSNLTLIINALIKTARVGIIDTVDSSQSRLADVQAGASHAVLVRGEVMPSQLSQRSEALKAELMGALSVTQTVLTYLKLGFVHIVPKGLDHILFVLALFLLSTRLSVLAIQVSIFTLAHTLTLALASLGLVQLPPSIVEPLIALSITYVAVENLSSHALKRSRMLIIFGFGMLHGLGFAGVLAELGLSSQYFYTSLISFNIGVEFGQLSVILIAVIALRWTQKYAWYTRRVVKPASILIALTGLVWGVERLVV